MVKKAKKKNQNFFQVYGINGVSNVIQAKKNNIIRIDIMVGGMAEKNTTRIDKWLCAVRIYKTRSIATEACAGGKVKIDGNTVKASRIVRIGEIIQVRKRVIKYDYKVLKISEKRMGANLVRDFMEDLTPDEELEKLKNYKRLSYQTREKGKGRPTKKERRIMDKLQGKY
jgi:ribosome-associated heat shock protein Hsp15